MKIVHLFEQRSVNWIKPTTTQIEEEWEYEYINSRRNWARWTKMIDAKFPLFENLEDFQRQIKSSEIVDFKGEPISNISEPENLDALKIEVATHSKPKDVDGLVKIMLRGGSMAAPIVIVGKRGRWLMSGNTRWNIARLFNIPISYVAVDGRNE